MTNGVNIKGEQHIRYNLKVWHKKDGFYILKNISEYVTLVQLMESLGNVNHAISILGYWIFYSKYEKALCPTQESLYLLCSPSIGKEQVATFQSVSYNV